MLKEKLKRPIPAVPSPSMEALCVTAYRRGAGEGEKVVAHFVNYKCQVPLNAKEAWNLAPQPARNIRVRLPLSRVTGARLIDPDGAPPQPLVYAQKGDVVDLIVPEVRIHKIVERSSCSSDIEQPMSDMHECSACVTFMCLRYISPFGSRSAAPLSATCALPQEAKTRKPRLSSAFYGHLSGAHCPVV